MTLQQNKNVLETRMKNAQAIPAKGTPLANCAREILEMVNAYHQDGMTFLIGGDSPNALASYSYALGWLDAGSCLGLITAMSCGFPLDETAWRPGDPGDSGLSAKTSKYQALLGTAITKLEPAPEHGSCLHGVGERILMIARVFHEQGVSRERSGDCQSGLAMYSYGFGWLDAGVRIGLFRIRDHREMFTI
jgi:hypothetical protein